MKEGGASEEGRWRWRGWLKGEREEEEFEKGGGREGGRDGGRDM